jgi:hypothetical protein
MKKLCRLVLLTCLLTAPSISASAQASDAKTLPSGALIGTGRRAVM